MFDKGDGLYKEGIKTDELRMSRKSKGEFFMTGSIRKGPRDLIYQKGQRSTNIESTEIEVTSKYQILIYKYTSR